MYRLCYFLFNIVINIITDFISIIDILYFLLPALDNENILTRAEFIIDIFRNIET